MRIIECNLPRTGSYVERNATTAVVLHHAEASSATVWDINSWHLANGWNGIGYHYYVRKDGSVYRGRPDWALGSHAKGANDYSIGVCCEGAYMTETMPKAQLDSLKALLRDIMRKWGKLRLLRHKDVSATDCPGMNFPWAAVQEYEKEDDEMLSYEQFEAYMNRYIKENECKGPSAWASKDWQTLTAAGITDGTAPRAPLTREQYAVRQVRQGMIGK